MKSIQRSILSSVSLLASLLVGSVPATATTITFDEFAPPAGSVLSFSSLSSAGFQFTAQSGSLLISDNGQTNIPNTGSNTLVANGAQPSSFSMTAVGGSPFDLVSLLAIEGRNTNTGFFVFSATAVQLLGTFHGGGTISTTLTFDLFAQENNALDSQLFTFSGWTNLDSVAFTGVGGQWNGYSFGFDNIVVNESSNVPDQGLTLSLLGTVLLGLAAARRRFGRA